MDKTPCTETSLIIPVYNESCTITNILNLAICSNIGQIIVVDDGSTDDSLDRIKTMQALDPRIMIVAHTANKGVGAARASGIRASTGNIIAFLDADLQDLKSDIIDRIVAPVVSGTSDFVLGAFENEGRVTELTIRPLLRVCFPKLCELRQPLSGQFACRRKFLYPDTIESGNQMSGILLDAYIAGARIGEVSIGTLVHSKRDTEVKKRQAFSECEAFMKRYVSVLMKAQIA
jgi:glucosyl-3-phosphoglycerate synthase